MQAQYDIADHPSEFEEEYGHEHDAPPNALADCFADKLGNVPRRPLLTLSLTTSVGEAIRALNERHTGCALVVGTDGRLAGIFTERDVLTKVAGKLADLDTTPLYKIMTPDPDTLPESATVAYALQRMSVEGYRHLPLVDERSRPIGVVAVRDIIAWLCEMFPSSILNLPPEPGYPKSVDGG